MEEIFDKLENLKKALDDMECIKKIKELNKDISNNKELLSLIEKYNYTKAEALKKEILNNKLFQQYKNAETELNFLILEINQELKKIIKKDKCSL